MKILIIDDEDLVRRALERACLKRGHSVLTASGGVDGKALWLESNPDLIFLDVLMPDINGPKVIEDIGDKNSSKIVLMSAYTGGYDLEKAQSLGADLFIPKPFEDVFQTVIEAENIF